MICRGKELQKTQTEHQTETAETTCCCPLPQPHTTCRRSQGVGRGVEKEEAGRAFITSLTGLQCQKKRHIMAHGSLPTSLPPHTHIIGSPDVNIFLPSLCPTIMQYQITEIDA